MSANAKYLRIKIRNNDFIYSLKTISELIYKIFQTEDNYPTEEDFSYLKEYIKHLCFGEYMIGDLICLGELFNDNINIDDFEPYLEFVDYLDIPDWDNYESVYIPMFVGEILIR